MNNLKVEEIYQVFLGLQEIIEDNEGSIERITSTLSRMSKIGQRLIERNLYLVPFEDSVDDENGCETLHRRMMELKDEAFLHKVEHLTLDMAWEIDREKLRKITEHVFRNQDIKVLILTPREHPKRLRGQRARKRADLETVFVKKTGTYADMLRSIKDKVDVGNLHVDIQAIQKTKNGDMLFTVKKGGAQQLKEQIVRNTGIPAEA